MKKLESILMECAETIAVILVCVGAGILICIFCADLTHNNYLMFEAIFTIILGIATYIFKLKKKLNKDY